MSQHMLYHNLKLINIFMNILYIHCILQYDVIDEISRFKYRSLN